MYKIKIESGIPIEKSKGGRKSEYGFDKLKVGDSILIKTKDIHSARNAALQFASRNKMTFETSKKENGIRVWRTK